MHKDKLKAWQNGIMVDVDCPIDEINALMSFEYHEFNEMNTDELFNHVWMLRKYTLFLKQEQNKYTAQSRWIKNKIFEVAKPEASLHSSYDKDERLYSAIKENDFLKKMEEKKQETELMMNSLYELDRSVGYLVSMLDRLLQQKMAVSSNKARGNI